MTETLTVHPQILNYYNYNVICNYCFEEPEPVIQNTYTYEENGVYYCASATEKGVYWYIYARNCPLMYTDPDGHKLKWWGWLMIGLGIDALTGGAMSLTAFTTATIASAPITTNAVSLMAFNTTTYTILLPFQHTLSAIDITVNLFRSGEGNYKGLYNAINIDLGISLSFLSIFDFDKSASPMEWAMQLYNNLSFGEQLQTSIGRGFAHMQSIGGYVDRVGFYKGRTVVRLQDDYIAKKHIAGISFGHYVLGNNIALNPYDKEHDTYLFAHEFGHTYQSRTSGLLYLFKYGIPSAVSNKMVGNRIRFNIVAIYMALE